MLLSLYPRAHSYWLLSVCSAAASKACRLASVGHQAVAEAKFAKPLGCKTNILPTNVISLLLFKFADLPILLS